MSSSSDELEYSDVEVCEKLLTCLHTLALRLKKPTQYSKDELDATRNVANALSYHINELLDENSDFDGHPDKRTIDSKLQGLSSLLASLSINANKLTKDQNDIHSQIQEHQTEVIKILDTFGTREAEAEADVYDSVDDEDRADAVVSFLMALQDDPNAQPWEQPDRYIEYTTNKEYQPSKNTNLRR